MIQKKVLNSPLPHSNIDEQGDVTLRRGTEETLSVGTELKKNPK